MRNTLLALLLTPALFMTLGAQDPKASNSRATDQPPTLAKATGCLTKDGANGYTLTDDSNVKIAVAGAAELNKHVTHRVTLVGTEKTVNGKAVFTADRVEMISTDCTKPPAR